MSRRDFYPFYPERILWAGAAVLGGGLAVGVAFLVFWLGSPPLIFSQTSERKAELDSEAKNFSFSFNLKEAPIAFPFPRVEPEVSFSLDPPRPDCGTKSGGLFIHSKQSGELKRISLPCRVDLQCNDGKLVFREQSSSFWLELVGAPEGGVWGTVWIETVPQGKIAAEQFIALPQVSSIRGAQEFPEGSPFRILGEARCLGRDVFSEKYGGKQTLRLVVGLQPTPQVLNLREKEWIVWHDGRWMQGDLDKKFTAAAYIESVDSKALILEGWDEDGHARLSLAFSTPPPFKVRGEEIFSSIRVRSEKQISCMMEKQCLILRSGDWVIKANGRWKILRKKEEKEAYKSGKIGGELFVFEKIESKQEQKFISGFLFNAEKLQVVPIDLPVNKQTVSKGTK